MSEALRLAHELILAMRDTDAEHWDTLEEAASELRRLHAELERKSDAIQRLWKERDELRALNAELVEALRGLAGEVERFGLHHPDGNSNWWPVALEKAQAALAKVEASK